MSMYILKDKCIECGACWAECPAEAIVHKDKFEIIEEKCLDCGACEYVCHFDAIFYDKNSATE